MNEYIGTVKDSYMFTNRLSNITVGDILYNYEKIKYHRMAMTPQDKADWYNGYLPKDTPKEEFAKPEEYTFSAFNTSKIYGTGKINTKYRVVEVIENVEMSKDYISIRKHQKKNGKTITIMGIGLYGRVNQQCELGDHYYIQVGFSKQEHEKYGYKNEKHVIRLELIEQVDIELSELYNATRYEHYLTVKDNGLDMTSSDTFKFTKYNGLQKVIYIGDNK